MLYTEIQPQSFLSSGEKIFLSVLPYMGMASILLNGADPFEQIVNILSTERRPYVNHVESSENCFKEEDIKRLYNFIHVYSPRTKDPRSLPSKILTVVTVLLL